jgi:hypothetical protein
MNRIIRFSGKLSFTLLIIITIIIAVATFVEKQYGSEFVYLFFYTSPWFIACWFTLAIYGLIYLLSQKTYKKLPVICLHIAFLFILTGALLTHISSQNGTFHLRKGESNHFYYDETNGKKNIPFT